MKSLFTAQLCLSLAFVAAAAERPDVVFADFEGKDYGAWTTEGTAFGSGPARGTLPGQMSVEGFRGKGLVNSFNGGDNSTGRLTSPPFKIERGFITFLIGGGGYAGETCMNLIVDGKVVRTATGPNTVSGGSERLAAAAWDVGEFSGRAAAIEIVDERKGGWGHINADHIVQSDIRGDIALADPPARVARDVRREVIVEKKLLHFPVKNGAKKRTVTLSVDGAQVRRFDIELADSDADWWAPLDVTAWAGKTLSVVADVLPESSRALDSLRQSDTLLGSENLYREPLRPQLQFSAKRGWLNDPNGLAFYNGEYHLFFQHNPYGWGWGNMHWGHATSHDLVHWQEHGDVLYPDAMGAMFSGSAVVDWKNTSGFGSNGRPPLVLIYTAAGNPTTQCLAYSTDGRTFTKFSGNPVVKQITGGNRDPKVFWHEPTKKWVLVLYVGLPNPDGARDSKGRPAPKHTIHFFTSINLRDWSLASIADGGSGDDRFLYECPDFFELPVDGDASGKKWVLTAANSDYAIGTFDGTKFTPETPRLPGHRGRGFYAAQTFSDTPDGRRIQIGWGQMPSPGMPFNQLQMLPCELRLRQTPDGARLAWQPVQELGLLRSKSWKQDALKLTQGGVNPLADVRGELLELRMDFQPATDSEVILTVRGVEIRYTAATQEISAAGFRAPAPLQGGRQRLVIFTDRTSFSVFASDGLTYMPFPMITKPEELGVELKVKGGATVAHHLEAHNLKSIWSRVREAELKSRLQ
ncbi:MAG: glycoside hydrolase family 32 protein [Limisphaerales bacterium]